MEKIFGYQSQHTTSSQTFLASSLQLSTNVGTEYYTGN